MVGSLMLPHWKSYPLKMFGFSIDNFSQFPQPTDTAFRTIELLRSDFGEELVNAPANVLIPGVLVEEASKVASSYGDVILTATMLHAEQRTELKMGSYLGVAAASSNPPHFIHYAINL